MTLKRTMLLLLSYVALAVALASPPAHPLMSGIRARIDAVGTLLGFGDDRQQDANPPHGVLLCEIESGQLRQVTVDDLEGLLAREQATPLALVVIPVPAIEMWPQSPWKSYVRPDLSSQGRGHFQDTTRPQQTRGENEDPSL